jgi:hypothetical protein
MTDTTGDRSNRSAKKSGLCVELKPAADGEHA